MPRRRPPPSARALEQQRRLIALEAARLLSEGGPRDYRRASRKAAERLGLLDPSALPGNAEIEQALREYQRLFAGDTQPQALRLRRQAALHALEFFAPFNPRLTGPVLDGSADAHSPVSLHLHCDEPEAVGRFLADHRVPADADAIRLRRDRQHMLTVPRWRFVAESLAFELCVLPCAALHQAPLSPIDDRPLQRASLTQLRRLLAD